MKKITLYIVIFVGIISVLLFSDWTNWKKLGLKGKIAYIGTFEQMRVLDLATGRDIRLGKGSYSPVLSPDGKKIVFQNYSDKSVVIKDVNSGKKETIDYNYYNFSWSPDMTKLACSEIGKTMLFDLLTKEKNYIDFLSYVNWSPDSKKIVGEMDKYNYKTGYYENEGVCIINLENMDKQEFYKGFEPQFSPDGKEIVFVEKSKIPYLIWLFSLETGEKKKLAEDGENPIFSPDGKKIVFLEEGKKPSMWLIYLETGEKKKLIEDKGWGYQFSPDSKKIAFFRGQFDTNSNLWVIDTDGNNLKQLTFIDFSKKDYRDYKVTDFQWIENGKIIYEKWPFDTETLMAFYYLYTINPDGTNNKMLKRILGTAF